MISFRPGAGLKSVAMMMFLISACAPVVTWACICDEICHPGEVYSDEHEMCIADEGTADEQTEKPTS